jgi:hypothetical protein
VKYAINLKTLSRGATRSWWCYAKTKKEAFFIAWRFWQTCGLEDSAAVFDTAVKHPLETWGPYEGAA